MPAALMTLPHFCVSAAWNFASSSGVVVKGSVPLVSKKAFAAGALGARDQQLVQLLRPPRAACFAGT